VLRLWPEQITVGLFPGHCWMRRHGKHIPLDIERLADASALAAALDTLLGMQPVRGARLDIIASDKMARIVGLPWQEQLRSEPERYAYALAAFTHAGMPVDESWVCSTAFRRYRELGLGIACRVQWIEQLEAIAQGHGVRLRTLVPVSLAAYRAPRKALGKGSAWLLVEEGDRAASLCFDGGRLSAYDAQLTGGEPQGLKRLLLRQALAAGEPDMVSMWRVDGEPRSALVSAMAPDALVKPLAHHHWDVHA
jgi:hypothetical protein